MFTEFKIWSFVSPFVVQVVLLAANVWEKREQKQFVYEGGESKNEVGIQKQV